MKYSLCDARLKIQRSKFRHLLTFTRSLRETVWIQLEYRMLPSLLKLKC